MSVSGVERPEGEAPVIDIPGYGRCPAGATITHSETECYGSKYRLTVPLKNVRNVAPWGYSCDPGCRAKGKIGLKIEKHKEGKGWRGLKDPDSDCGYWHDTLCSGTPTMTWDGLPPNAPTHSGEPRWDIDVRQPCGSSTPTHEYGTTSKDQACTLKVQISFECGECNDVH